MELKEYLTIRVQNGKITVPDVDPHTGKKNEDTDSAYIKEYGSNLIEFWDNAKTQKALLWAMRGLGLDSDADMLWDCIAKSDGIILHQTRMTPEQSLNGANFIRDVFKNPFTLLPTYIWTGQFREELGYINMGDPEEESVVHVHFACPICDEPDAGTSMHLELTGYIGRDFSCEECASCFSLKGVDTFSIRKIESWKLEQKKRIDREKSTKPKSRLTVVEPDTTASQHGHSDCGAG